MADDHSQRTHAATPHRRKVARENGQIPKSRDLASALFLLGALVGIALLGGRVAHFLVDVARQQLGGQAVLATDTTALVQQWRQLAWQAGVAVLPLLGSMLLVAIAVHLVQTGWVFLPQKAAPDFQRIQPGAGLGRMFASANIARTSLGLIKLSVILLVAFGTLYAHGDEILSLATMEVAQLADVLSQSLLAMLMYVGVALVVLALADYGIERWRFEQSLKMTSRELREEIRNQEGDPEIAARRRSVRQQLASQRVGRQTDETNTR